MNPQYMPQQPSQYGGPSLPGYGPATGNYPQSAPSPSPSGTPVQYPPPNIPGSQRGPQPDFGGPGVSNGQLDGPPQFFLPGGQPPNQRGPHTVPPHLSQIGQPPRPTGSQPQSNQLVNQMSTMNLSGPQRPPSQGYPGGPMKPGLTSPGSTFSQGSIPSSFPPAVNGGLLHLHETHPSPQNQFTNGSMAPPSGLTGALQGQMPPPLKGPTQSLPPHGSPGPQQGQFGPPQGQMAPPQSHIRPPGPMGPSQTGPSTQGPLSQPSGPPRTAGPPSGPPQMGGPPSGHPQMGGPPSGHPQMGGPPSGHPQMGGPPSGHPQMGGPPSGHPQMGGPPSGHPQMGGPPSGHSQMGGPPSGHSQMGGPPSGHSQMGGPPSGHTQMGGPPSGHTQMGGPHSGQPQMGGPPSGHPQMGGPPSGPQQIAGQSSAPPQIGGPPSGLPQMGGPPSGPPQMGGPSSGRPQMGGPPSGPSQMGGLPSGSPQMGGPPSGPPQLGLSQMSGPPSGPPQMGGLLQMSGPPSGPPQMGGLSQMSGPPSGPPQMGGLPPGPPQSHIGMAPPQAVVHPMVSSPSSMTPYPPTSQPGYPPTSQGMYGAQQPPMSQSYPGPPQPMGMGQYPSAQPQQARRLDPDQMPSPIQVMMDDQRNRSGVFYTNQKGQVPPIVTTTFTTQDQGNCGPRFIRSTMYNVPATIDMMKQTAVPFGLVISPLATVLDGEYEPPIVDMGELGPVRCIRCKAYMCPFMQFIDGGRRFHCLFCKATTEVPGEYFQHLDHTGQRVDRFERPELILGTYEFVATKDYCRNNEPPKPPAMIFLIDVSYNNIKSGLVNLLCSRMKEIVQTLPKENGADKSNMKVGFITYNSTVHFYNIKGSLAQPQMMVVGDIQDMFMPLLDGFLVEPSEAEQVIDSLMVEIPAMFADTRETETLLAPAIQAGLEALKASECAGKLLVFHSSLPIAEAPGKLKNRDDRKLLGTDKEKTVLVPQTNVYNNLGQECVGFGCSVDLFLFNNSYIDIATIGQVSRLTGGEVFKYTYFQSDLDGERLIADIKRDVSRPVAFDAIMRVRTSTGVRPTDFYGHFFMSNTTDMELASIDCDKAVALEIKHDDKLTEEDGVYIQVALLYTSCSGQRRLRILNLSLKTCSQMADLYRSCDLDTVVNFFAKQSVFRLLESAPKPVKDNLVNRCAQILACYRKNCASPSSAGQLILPECMKLLPLYVNCILKSDAVSGGSEMTLDDRAFVMQAVTIMDIPSSVVFFYPRLLPLIDLDENAVDIPSPVRCSSDKLRDDGAYLLENGIHMFLWIGLNVNVDWVHNVFGVHSAAQIDIDRTTLPELSNPLSFRIRSLIEAVRQNRHRCMRLTLVRQRDKMELVFKHFLVEDRGMDSSASYVDFLCHMHKEIRSLLS